jgi:uncharacterized protein YndB with AHSA1/START domain
MFRFLFSWCCCLISYALNSQSIVDKINWPPNYEPAESKFYVQNEIEIEAPPELVWQILIDARRWPSWYSGAKSVTFPNQADSNLIANTEFRWKTMGLKFASRIKEYEPGRYLAWESKKKSIRGYHVWLIIPVSQGCKVVTAESQNGWLTFFEKTFQPKKLKKLHDVWLLELKQKSERLINPS